jgi:hypothetical protein
MAARKPAAKAAAAAKAPARKAAPRKAAAPKKAPAAKATPKTTARKAPARKAPAAKTAARKAAPRKAAARKPAARKTASGKPLRAVGPNEKPPPKAPRAPTLAEAIEGDDYLEILMAQRREMVRDVKAAAGPAKAALHRQIGLASKEIAALQAAAAEEASENAEGATEDEPFDPAAI